MRLFLSIALVFGVVAGLAADRRALLLRNSPSGSASWTPQSPANTLRQWNRPEDLTVANNDPTNQWVAVVGQPLQNAGGSVRPLVKTGGPNGNKYLLFDGTDDYLSTANWAGAQAQPFTIAIAWKMEQAGSYNGYILDGNSDPGRAALLSRGANDDYAIYAGLSVQTTGLGQGTSWHFAFIRYGGTTSSNSIDGGSWTAFAATPGADTMTGLTIGMAYDGTSIPGNVSIGEPIVWDGALSNADFVAATNYFHGRWK